MYAPKHPWFTAVAGLGLALGLVTAMDTSAPALRLASDAFVMPSAAPLPEPPAQPATATQSLTDQAADGALDVPGPPTSALTDEEPATALTDEAPSTSALPGEASSTGGAAAPDVAEAPMAGPVQPGRNREPEPEPVTVGGTLLVPTEIQPGTYQGTVPEDSSYCYWTRLSGTSGEAGDIIAGDFVWPGERITVTISEDDAAFAHSGCGTLTQ
jgi:hypothetical protein